MPQQAHQRRLIMRLSFVKGGAPRFNHAYSRFDSAAIVGGQLSASAFEPGCGDMAVCVVLALTNPTTDQYLGFVQTKLPKP